MNNAHKNAGEIVAPAPAQVASGGVAVFESVLGVAVGSYASGETGVFKTAGQFRLPKASAAEFGVCEKVNWDATAGEFVAASSDVDGGAMAVEAAGSGDTEVVVELLPGQGAAGGGGG